MSLGKMNETIELIAVDAYSDPAGFGTTINQGVIASIRAHVEQRHATSAWVNRAAYSKATTLFRFRMMPGVPVSEEMEIHHDTHRYQIDSVEVIHGRYVEVLAHRTTPEGDLTKRSL